MKITVAHDNQVELDDIRNAKLVIIRQYDGRYVVAGERSEAFTEGKELLEFLLQIIRDHYTGDVPVIGDEGPILARSQYRHKLFQNNIQGWDDHDSTALAAIDSYFRGGISGSTEEGKENG